MRILMIQTYYYYRGGDSTYMFNLTKLLEEKGHEVVPFAMQHPKNLPSPYSRFFVSEIDFPALLEDFSLRAKWRVISRCIYNGEAARRIEELIGEVEPDVAHIQNIHGHITTSIFNPLRRRGIPIVWTLHDYRLVCPNTTMLCGGEICERCLPGRLYEVVLHRCKKGSLAASLAALMTSCYDRLTRVPARVARFIAPSEFLISKLVEGGFDREKVTWLPNFVDLDAYRRGGEGGYFLYFGRLSWEKGLDVLIRAVGRLGRGRLLVAGEGPARAELVELAAGQAAGRIEFLGYRSGEELKTVLEGSQFVVLPSRWYENLPFAVMEAMAAGKPVVAAAIGGIPEMVEDGVTGLLFPVGDVDALTERLGGLLDAPDLRGEMGRRGREKAERLYNREWHYERLMEIYRSVTGAGD